MTTITQYRLYCNDEGAPKTVWAYAAPTVCPANAAHAINPDSIHEVSKGVPQHRTGFLGKTNATTTWTTVAQVSFQGTATVGAVVAIEVLSTSASTVTNYQVRVVNGSNAQVLCEAVFTNKTPTIQSLGALANLPAGKTVLNIDMKRTGSGSATIQDLVIYTE